MYVYACTCVYTYARSAEASTIAASALEAHAAAVIQKAQKLPSTVLLDLIIVIVIVITIMIINMILLLLLLIMIMIITIISYAISKAQKLPSAVLVDLDYTCWPFSLSLYI